MYFYNGLYLSLCLLPPWNAIKWHHNSICYGIGCLYYNRYRSDTAKSGRYRYEYLVSVHPYLVFTTYVTQMVHKAEWTGKQTRKWAWRNLPEMLFGHRSSLYSKHMTWRKPLNVILSPVHICRSSKMKFIFCSIKSALSVSHS